MLIKFTFLFTCLLGIGAGVLRCFQLTSNVDQSTGFFLVTDSLAALDLDSDHYPASNHRIFLPPGAGCPGIPRKAAVSRHLFSVA